MHETATGSAGARHRGDVMHAQVGDVLLYQGKPHRVTEVVLRGFVPPYFRLACAHAGPCDPPQHPVSHWNLRLPEVA